MAEFKLPTEVIDLPSKGLLYPKDNPLSEGKIEIKYMTAKEEDILSNSSYIKQGIVLDKLFKSLIVTKFNYDDLLIGDKNALMIAARVLGYGGNYEFEYNGEKQLVDLSKLEFINIDEKLWANGNNFEYTLPSSKNKITFKLLTHGDEMKISREVKSLQKINKDSDSTLTTRLKYMITSVEGQTETKQIREFVDNYLLARDSRALREYIKEVQPDIDLTFFPPGSNNRRAIPIGLSLFWPDLG
jgi:hypothetical protein|tara:strand:- start:559 stop:1287 length:729 start_codon:yes stop_codon:yes gene_type:complete